MSTQVSAHVSSPLTLTTAQAAARLGVHRATVYRLIAAGDLAAVDLTPGKTGARQRVLTAEVDALVVERTTRT